MSLSVRRVSKKFTRQLKRSLLYGLSDIGAEIANWPRNNECLRKGEFWALRDVSVDVPKGQALGLIGTNGSGKTTLLRLISGLIKLDSGEIRIRGSVAPLIALGAGFNPVLTGRENIFVNMAILGLKHREILDRFDAVLDFAELGSAIEAPVQTYSSGMAARLGFSCAVHTRPDIMLIDEVLSVGDMRFRSKCYRRLAELKRGGTSFILVSHNSNAIISMCDSVLYLDEGRVVMYGTPSDAMSQYERNLSLNTGHHESGELWLPRRSPEESAGLDITGIEFTNADGKRIPSPETGRDATLRVHCYASKKFDEVTLGVIIRHASGEMEPVLNLSSERDGRCFQISEGWTVLSCHLPQVNLRPGGYSAKVYVARRGLEVFDAVESFRFEAQSQTNMTDCAFFQAREWRNEPQNLETGQKVED